MPFDNSTPVFVFSATCPECRAPLRLRHRRSDNEAFVGCSSFPGCRYVVPYDEVIDQLAKSIKAAEIRPPVADFAPAALYIKSLERELKKLMAIVHPDKWGNHPLATELAKGINAIRANLKKSGTTRRAGGLMKAPRGGQLCSARA